MDSNEGTTAKVSKPAIVAIPVNKKLVLWLLLEIPTDTEVRSQQGYSEAPFELLSCNSNNHNAVRKSLHQGIE